MFDLNALKSMERSPRVTQIYPKDFGGLQVRGRIDVVRSEARLFPVAVTEEPDTSFNNLDKVREAMQLHARELAEAGVGQVEIDVRVHADPQGNRRWRNW